MAHSTRIDTLDTPQGQKFFAVCKDCGACSGGVSDAAHARSMLRGECPGRGRVYTEVPNGR